MQSSSANRTADAATISRNFSGAMPSSVRCLCASSSASRTSGCIRSWIFKYASIDASSCVSSESSLTAIQRAGSFLRFSGSRAGTNSPSARSTASGYRVRSGFVSGGLRHIRSTAPVSCSNPLLLRALVPITGTPSRRESRGRSIRICFFPASSSRLTQSTT